MLFKYLGFSLDDIKNITVGDSDYNILINSLHLQLNLIKDKIAQMQLVKNAIEDTEKILKDSESIDWSSMLSLIHLTNMENSLKTQYLNAGNISARINLHAKYSVNKQGWFSWIYEQCGLEPGIKVLETGCGDGRLWVDNIKNVEKLKNIKITVTDISEGMVNDARRNIGNGMFDYGVADCMNLPFDDNSFDCVIANHVIFYCEEPGKAFKEIKRVLKPGGKLIYSTCTFSPEENEQSIEYLLSLDDSLSLVELPLFDGWDMGHPLWAKKDWQGSVSDMNVGIAGGDDDSSEYNELTKCRRLWPHRVKGEGHFVAMVEKSVAIQSDKGSNEYVFSRERLSNEAEDFIRRIDYPFDLSRMDVLKDKVYYIPHDMPDVKGLRILRCGLLMGEIKKNRFEPSQALAMFLKNDEFDNTLSLKCEDDRVVRYLKGETIELLGDEQHDLSDGYVLICVDDYPLGWGKNIKGVIKNKYLPGWRMM